MAQAAVTDKCDLCESANNVDFFCVHCDEILCTSCKVSHAKSKATKNHNIIPLSRARDDNIVHKSTVIYCSKHSTIEITLFCLKCNQLICTQCLIKQHYGHNIAELDQISDSKTDELKSLIKTLKEKKSLYENVFQAEGQGHSRFLQSIDQAEKDILAQKASIIEELDAVCEEQLSDLSKLRQDEEKRYSDVCNKYQAQSQTFVSTILTAQNSITSNNAVLIIRSTVDTTDTLQKLDDPPMPPITLATYQPGDRSRPTICVVQGKVNIKRKIDKQQPDDRTFPATTKVLTERQVAKPELIKEVHRVKFKGRNTNGDNKPRIDMHKVKVTSTITIKGKNDIPVMVPLQDRTAWVKATGEAKLSLINNKGKIISKSVELSNVIIDAIKYRDGLLVICECQHKVIKLSADGKSTSTFSDLSPYQPKGLCVTQDIEIMASLQSNKDKNNNNKVVRLNSEGNIIQTIQYDATGDPLYKDPWGITSLTTGEVIVVDNPDRIIGVDSQGQHLFTWGGEVQGRKLDKHVVVDITHDSNNNLFDADYYNSRVYVLGKDGSGAMCLLDSTKGIYNPNPVAIDDQGQLWVGCMDGKIHIIEY